MHVSFADPRLALIETHRAAETALPFAVISTARTRLSVLRASPDFGTLVKWRSFGLPKDAVFPGQHAVRVDEMWEMTIAFEQDSEPRSLVLSVNEIRMAGGVVR